MTEYEVTVRFRYSHDPVDNGDPFVVNEWYRENNNALDAEVVDVQAVQYSDEMDPALD